MTENIATPYILRINEPIQTIHLSEQLNNLGIQFDPNVQQLTSLNPTNTQVFVKPVENPLEMGQETAEFAPENFTVVKSEEQPCIVQIVYPQDLCLSPAPNFAKRGRPKKKKCEDPLGDVPIIVPTIKPENGTNPPKTARTRSGRLVKLPKHIERDFKKIEITTEEQEIQVSDFTRFEENENPKIEFPELFVKKRVISSQYKCPKCFKAYLGKNKMIQHLKKYPDHGPLPEGFQQFNFDVWNYLFDITQKCKAGQRGIKFCEELSNLLHNVQLLKSALFKTVTDNKNCVHIDKVLGNAIGLTPGKYKFDENELYKDVTVLKLITNSEFFKPNLNNKQSNETVAKNEQLEECENKKMKQETQLQDGNFAMVDKTDAICPPGNAIDDNEMGHEKLGENVYNFASKTNAIEGSVPLKIEETVISNNFSKKMEVDNQMLSSDLLTENLLLHSLPNARTSDEELMLTSVVDNTANLLDNSTSSDEVMNVDQFVNERLKKIIGPDIELGNTSLNLDLPSLELFQFHTS